MSTRGAPARLPQFSANATFCDADWQTQCTQRSRVARAVVVRRTQDCNVPWFQIAQGLGMPVDDGDLIIRQQRQEPISDEMLGLSARAGAAFVGQLDDLQGGVVPGGVLRGKRSVIVSE